MAGGSPRTSRRFNRRVAISAFGLCGAAWLRQVSLVAPANAVTMVHLPGHERTQQSGAGRPFANGYVGRVGSVSWFNNVPRFGTYGDTSTSGNLGDCAVAAIADILQIQQKRGPLPAQPFIAAYEALATSDGETPSGGAALPVSQVLAAWSSSGIAGTSEPTRSVGTGRAAVIAALRRGPLYVTLDLPAPQPISVNVVNGVSTSPWVVGHPPKGYLSAGPHAAVAAGFNARYVYLVTWGYVVPVSWAFWENHAVGAWLPRLL